MGMSYRCQPDTSSNTINAKPLGAILSATQAINRSMPNQWERSQLICFNEHLSTINVNTDTS